MGVRTIFAEICSRAKRWPVVGARFIAPNRRQVSVLCGWGVPHPRATARVPSPRPHRTRPYKDTEQLILLRSLCKGGCGVVRSGDPCGRPGVGLWLLSLTPIGEVLRCALLRRPVREWRYFECRA